MMATSFPWSLLLSHTSRGSGKVLQRRRSSRELGDLSLVLETFFLGFFDGGDSGDAGAGAGLVMIGDAVMLAVFL